MNIWIVDCPKCGATQATEIRNIYKSSLHCKYCGKSTKVKDKQGIGFRLKKHAETTNPHAATKIVQALTTEKHAVRQANSRAREEKTQAKE